MKRESGTSDNIFFFSREVSLSKKFLGFNFAVGIYSQII
jgi:hypothetical protein